MTCFEAGAGERKASGAIASSRGVRSMKEPAITPQILPSSEREPSMHQARASHAGISEIDQKEGQSPIA
jgi:hypothetical protein